jgi:NADPH-dependent curcumin reductase
MPTKHYLIVQRARMVGFLVLDYMPRAAEAIGALAGWIQAESSKTRPTCSIAWRTRRRYCGGCSGKQLLRVAE